MRIEVLLDLKTRLGESPVWDVEQQRLWWVDSLDGRLFACNAQGGAIKSWDVRQKIGSFALRQSGEGAVVALQNGVHLLDFASGELTLLHHPEADRPFNLPLHPQASPRRNMYVPSTEAMQPWAVSKNM